MCDTVKVGFFFPFPIRAGNEKDRTLGKIAPKLFNYPDALNIGEININDASVNQPMGQQRFRILYIQAVNYFVLCRIETCSN